MLDLSRWSFGFHNPNHAAALVCALLPLCWGWRRHAWIGRALAAALVAMLLLTQSRTGFLVAGLEAVWWWLGKRRTACMAHVPCRRWWPWVVVGLAVAGLAFWWLGPRLVLDDSILNRPKIWLAGLRLFAANPGGVGLGNSGTLVSAFLLDDGVPEVRTLVNAHLTLLAEFGWIVGWAWCAFIVWALCGMGRSPRVGIAFAGLVASACSSTVFDWPVLFDVHGFGNLGVVNWILSWGMFVFFIGSGVWLVGGRSKLRPSRLESCGVSLREGRNLLRPRVLAVPVCSGGWCWRRGLSRLGTRRRCGTGMPSAAMRPGRSRSTTARGASARYDRASDGMPSFRSGPSRASRVESTFPASGGWPCSGRAASGRIS